MIKKFQVSISSNVWPSNYYWATLAEKNKVKFNGSSVTYSKARDMELELKGNVSYQLVLDKIKEKISSNYIKVNKTLTLTIIFDIFLKHSVFKAQHLF